MALSADLLVTALGGERLDSLVWRALGRASGAVEAVLAANPGLAIQADALPEGTEVVIPVAADAPPPAQGLVQLWD